MGGSSGVIAKKVADRVSMLMISVITARHAGEYVCTAENAAGTASHSTTLTVNGSGLFFPPPNKYIFFVSFIYIHTYTRLSFVFVRSLFAQQHSVSVKKKNSTVEKRKTHSPSPYPRFFFLESSNERSSLSLCLSSNRMITPVGPQLLPIAFNAEVANSGDSVSVPCSILKGDMPMDISWAFNGVAIDTSKDPSITVTRITKHLSTLSIDGVSARHAGEYACSASNLAGSVSRSATLTVNGTDISLFSSFPKIRPHTFSLSRVVSSSHRHTNRPSSRGNVVVDRSPRRGGISSAPRSLLRPSPLLLIFQLPRKYCRSVSGTRPRAGASWSPSLVPWPRAISRSRYLGRLTGLRSTATTTDPTSS